MKLQNIKHRSDMGSVMADSCEKPSETQKENLLSLAEASELLPAVSRHTLRRWAKANMVTHIELPGGRLWFRREDILALMKPVVANGNGAN